MKKAYITTLFLALVVSSGVLVFAQHSHQGHDVLTEPAGTQEKSFEQLMDKAMMAMDSGMKAAPMTGDPDHDFAAMMIPHHQGAIDMARAELLYGKDPVLRRLAQEIIVDQEQEIEVMRTRLKKFRTR
jgi:uncharacterized protein (DUF305 family)